MKPSSPTNKKPGTPLLLSFDLDDTLWPCMQTIVRAEEVLHDWFAEHHPHIVDRYTIDELRQKRIALTQKQPHLSHDISAIRKASFMELGQEFDYTGCRQQQFIKDAFEVYYQARNEVELYDDVLPTLSRLKENYRLVAVTNGNANIDMIGLSHLFEFSISAGDAGVQKPHPGIFEAVCQRAQVNLDSVVHIGDDIQSDILGAHNAGIRSIWLNRHASPWPDENVARAHSEISSLSQLPDALLTL